MSAQATARPDRTLILAPRGRDSIVAKGILREANLHADICMDLAELVQEIERGADAGVVTEEALRSSQSRRLLDWIKGQAAWSDFPLILLTQHGGGPERNPAAAELMQTLGNVRFLERPFHSTTLVSAVRAALRERQRQYECRRLNEELETRVQERTAQLAALNRQLLAQIEERERVESTLRQMQRLEAIGQLTSGVAHDFNNLLTVVLGNIVFLEKGLAAAGVDGKLTQRLSHMRSAAERGAKLTDQLLSFSRRQRLEPKALDINEAVAAMRDLLHSTIGGSVKIETKLSVGVWPALVDPTQLELAVLNLAINARDAMEVGGSLTVETGNVTLGPALYPEEPPAGDYVMVKVSDTGSGMSEEVRSKAFEPFFTTKDIGKGSGLGLSQVLGFAQQSGGGVRIETRLGEGTSIFIYLPRAAAHGAEPRPVPLAPLLHENRFRGARILLVDDDTGVRDVTATMLREFGYAVTEAASGMEALELLNDEPNIDLALFDYAMPGMNGAELARQVQLRRPHLPVLFLTGFADRAGLVGVGDERVVRKPFVVDDLAAKVRGALAENQMSNVVPLRKQDNR